MSLLDPNNGTTSNIIIDDASADLIVDFNILNIVVVVIINGEKKLTSYSVSIAGKIPVLYDCFRLFLEIGSDLPHPVRSLVVQRQ